MLKTLKKYSLGATVLIMITLGTSCVTPSRPTTNKISVVTSFYPLYYFASQIAGDKAIVTNLTPAGIEPHDYELTPQDLVVIQNSNILVLNGGQLEPWTDHITAQLSNTTTLVMAGNELATQQMTEENQLVTDPHVWLSPKLAQQQVKKITLGFIQADAAHSAYYLANEKNLIARLDELDTAYTKNLAQCSNRKIITSHTAFAYLANDYHLEQVAIAGLSPEAEPTAAELSKIVEFAQINTINYIFFENVVSPDLAETIANEVGAQTLVLNPLESLTKEELERDENYFSVMQENLNNLRLALDCT